MAVATEEAEVHQPKLCEVCGGFSRLLVFCHRCDLWHCPTCWGKIDPHDLVHCESCRSAGAA